MNNVKRIGVVGAGMMGAEIALCCARSGMDVTMKEVDQERADKGKETIEMLLSRSVARGEVDEIEKENTLARILATDLYEDFDEVDFVVEAISESLEMKRILFKDLDVICKPECIFASTTTSIPIMELAVTARPHRFVGLYFFAPASAIKFVEVIPGLITTSATLASSMAFCQAMGKEPVQVKAVEERGVNRILLALMNEAYRLFHEGVATQKDFIALCCLGLGGPMGPFRLSNTIGFDLLDRVYAMLIETSGDGVETPELFIEYLDASLNARIEAMK